MFDGAFLLRALYPDKATEINRIIVRGEIRKIIFVSAFFALALIFGHH